MEEILTIGAGFLSAGARTVINTLWSVDDLGTALFCIAYYEGRNKGLNHVESVYQAQLYLRNYSGAELEKIVTEYDLRKLLETEKKAAKAKQDEAKKKRDLFVKDSAEYKQWEEERTKHQKTANKITIVIKNIQKQCQEQLPFNHPFYWAAFQCQGMR